MRALIVEIGLKNTLCGKLSLPMRPIGLSFHTATPSPTLFIATWGSSTTSPSVERRTGEDQSPFEYEEAYAVEPVVVCPTQSAMELFELLMAIIGFQHVLAD
jgi:hypothetical protein